MFTLASELRALARFAPSAIYDLLFAAASDTLLTLGTAPKRIGGLLGLTAVLHTYGLVASTPGPALAQRQPRTLSTRSPRMRTVPPVDSTSTRSAPTT